LKLCQFDFKFKHEVPGSPSFFFKYMFGLRKSNWKIRLIQILWLKTNKVNDFSDFGFISVHLKHSKCLRQTVYNIWVETESGIGQMTSEMRRAPFMGLRFILYLRARTDSAQPIRVVQDSCEKGLNQYNACAYFM
jgi:hypothetical protein